MLVFCLSEGDFIFNGDEESKLTSDVAVKNQCPRRKVDLRLRALFPPLLLLRSLHPRQMVSQLL